MLASFLISNSKTAQSIKLSFFLKERQQNFGQIQILPEKISIPAISVVPRTCAGSVRTPLRLIKVKQKNFPYQNPKFGLRKFLTNLDLEKF